MGTVLGIWEKFWRKYQRWFAIAIAIIAIGLWVSVAILPKEIPFELATGISLTLVVFILGMVLDHLIALRKPAIITKFHSNQSNAQGETIKLVEELGTRSKAQLIEYSSRTVKEILEKLKSMEAEIELLICNPNYTITCKEERSIHSSNPTDKDFQKEQRVCPTIGDLQKFTLAYYDKVKIKCYRTPGSIRGRNFGDKWIQVGWYTYHTKESTEVFGSPQIWGDTNPAITAPTSSLEGQVLKGMFNEVFKKMWEESVSLIDVCGDCSNRAKCFGSIKAAKEWLQLVSPKEGETKDETEQQN